MGMLVSIIMPTYNAEPYIGEAIESVLAQRYSNWELLIVNDCSTDGTAAVIDRYTDARIRVIHRDSNGGIGAARNAAMEIMRGDALCTFDSDDVLPPDSLAVRVALLEREPHVDFVDGRVEVLDRGLSTTLRVHTPSFEGEPLQELLKVTGSCFFGPSWLIRWRPGDQARFSSAVTHAEDLLFYIGLAKGRYYKAVDACVLRYRVTGHSAMSRFDGLERSYRYLAKWLLSRPDLATREQAKAFGRRCRLIMFKTWLRDGKPLKAIKALLP